MLEELAWKETVLMDKLGDSKLLIEILNAMNSETENIILDYIAKNHDIDFDNYCIDFDEE